MPAVAHKPSTHQDYRAIDDERVPVRAKTPSGHRWHESPSRNARGGSSRARQEDNDSVDLDDLLEHFTGENAARTEHQQKEVEARRLARKRARLRHRPFRMTILASAMAGAPLALLACLLWMRSSSLAYSREDADLQKQIVAARFESERTREEIAAVNASPRVELWAKQRGWRRANQNDFDDVSKVVTPNTVQAVGADGENNLP